MNKRVYKVIIIVLFMLTASIKTIDTCESLSFNRNTKKIETYWNLDKLYSNDTSWKRDLKRFDDKVKELENYIGKTTESSMHLKFALQIKEELDMKLEKLNGYIKLKQDTNKKDYKYLDMEEELMHSIIEYSKICSYLELEILKVPNDEINKLLKDKKINLKYKMYINEIVRNKEHYLDEKSEKMLSDVSEISGLPKHVYELFNNMDKKSLITSDEYKSIIENGTRDQRKLAYQNEFIVYNDNINMLSGLLIGQVKKNQFYSTQRNYDSSMQMYLKSDNIDVSVYNKLIETVNDNLDSLHKYIDLRKEVLNLEDVYSYDMRVPIVEAVDNNIGYEKAQGIIYSSLSPLGKEYGDVIYKAFNEKWIDVYSNENKVGGAYCLSIYDNHPYILVNYNNTLNSVSTLAHELGHGVYEYISSKNQNYLNSNPSIFTHEVASVTNEVLLYENLIKNAENENDKAYYIAQYLDLIKDTMYIQTMYAEFEKEIHEIAEKHGTINTLVLNDLWGDLLKKYYGSSYKLDQLSKTGWSRIPHFYNSFYVYKYATGCSAGVSFAQQIIKNGEKDYIEFLKKGSSDYPIQTLKEAGVDLNSTKPIQDTIDKFDELLKELETIVKD